MNATPFFSIIMPTYNRADRILPTLQSIFEQQFVDFELIVVDDGSKDGTEDLIKRHFGTEKRLNYFYKKNEERSIARNFGLAKAQGKYAVFFDSDDYMHPDHLACFFEKINLYPDCRFFTNKYKIVEDSGRWHYSGSYIYPEGFYDYRILLQGSNIGVLVCAKLPLPYPFSVEFNILEDWIFNLMNLKNQAIYISDSVTVTVADHAQRSTANNQRVISNRLRAMDYLLEKLDFSDNEQKILKGYSYRYCAIHAYLDKDRKAAFGFWKKMVAELGYSLPHIFTCLKILVGKSTIELIQKYFFLEKRL